MYVCVCAGFDEFILYTATMNVREIVDAVCMHMCVYVCVTEISKCLHRKFPMNSLHSVVSHPL